MKLAFINLNSLLNKLQFIYDFIRLNKIDILAIGETWLLPDVPDSLTNITGFSIERCDVLGTVKKHGVCLYISEKYKYVRVDVQCENVVVVHLFEFDVYVVVVYRPPSYSPAQNEDLLGFLDSFVFGREVVVLGDFNLSSLSWGDGDDVGVGATPRDLEFLNCFTSLGLTQHVSLPTFYPSGNTLDLALTTEHDRVCNVDVLPPLPSCQHCPILIGYLFQFEAEQTVVSHTERNWHKGNYLRMERLFADVDWNLEFSGMDAGSMYERFLSIVLELVAVCVPLKKCSVGLSRCFAKPPTSLLRSRSRLWSQYKSVRTQFGRNSLQASAAYSDYRDINQQYREYSLRKTLDYEREILSRSKLQPKLFHSYIRGKKTGRPKIGPLRLPNGVICSDSLGMADCFLRAFSSVHSGGTINNPAPHQLCSGSFDSISLSEGTVRVILSKLDPYSAMGADGIHPRVLKECCDSLAIPLSMIFKASVLQSCVPAPWKHSLVVPIFKKGSRMEPPTIGQLV